MAYVPRARDLPGSLTGESVRLASREQFDYRKAVQAPSATGGAPKQPHPAEPQLSRESPMPMLTAPQGTTAAEQEFWRMREQRTRMETPIVPMLLQGSRDIDQYRVTNEPFVAELASAFEQYAASNPEWAARAEAVGGVGELALRMVAQVQRGFELESQGLSLPDQINATRAGREARRTIEAIRARRALR